MTFKESEIHVNPEKVNADKYLRTVAATGQVHHKLGTWNVHKSKGLDCIDDKDWELFHTSHRGTVDGIEYVWGMFAEGMGCFNVMIPFSNIRKLNDKEREYYSNITMGMYGSYSEKLSFTYKHPVIEDEEL